MEGAGAVRELWATEGVDSRAGGRRSTGFAIHLERTALSGCQRKRGKEDVEEQQKGPSSGRQNQRKPRELSGRRSRAQPSTVSGPEIEA